MSIVNWGLIGCGDVARKRVAQAIQDDPQSSLLAACRRDEAKLGDFCDAFRVPRRYSSAEELLGDREIHAVYIATPVREHLALTVAAARAGKHVLVEKPMAMNAAECDTMITACHRAGVRLGVAYYRRFYPMVHRIQDLIRSGEIGTPLGVSAVTSTPLAMQPGEEGYWRAILQHGGGGALMDVGSHRLDLFRYFFGEPVVVKAICETVAADYEAEDTAVLLLKFPGGMVGTLQCHFGCADPDQFIIQGTEGRLVAQPLNGDRLVVETRGRRRSEKHPAPSNLCAPLVEDFVSAILQDRQPTITGEEGRQTSAVIDRAYADARAGST